MDFLSLVFNLLSIEGSKPTEYFYIGSSGFKGVHYYILYYKLYYKHTERRAKKQILKVIIRIIIHLQHISKIISGGYIYLLARDGTVLRLPNNIRSLNI